MRTEAAGKLVILYLVKARVSLREHVRRTDEAEEEEEEETAVAAVQRYREGSSFKLPFKGLLMMALQ